MNDKITEQELPYSYHIHKSVKLTWSSRIPHWLHQVRLSIHPVELVEVLKAKDEQTLDVVVLPEREH